MLRIKELRREFHLTQKQLSSILHISQSVICDYENGNVSPTADVIIKMCDFFDVSADYLLGRTDY